MGSPHLTRIIQTKSEWWSKFLSKTVTSYILKGEFPQIWDGYIWLIPGNDLLSLKAPLHWEGLNHTKNDQPDNYETRLGALWAMPIITLQFSSVQLLSRVRLFVTPWTAACQASLATTNSRNFLKLMSIESVMPSNDLTLCHPLLLPPSIFPSSRVLSNESVLRIRWPKYWSFSFSISPSCEYSELISFRIDWCDLLAALGI